VDAVFSRHSPREDARLADSPTRSEGTEARLHESGDQAPPFNALVSHPGCGEPNQRQNGRV